MTLKDTPGIFGGASLHPVETATTVRLRDDQLLVTDVPFADTKEIFAGFYLLEADDLDQAAEIAARIPAARIGGSVEIRPVVADQHDTHDARAARAGFPPRVMPGASLPDRRARR